jgi:hypothetical protein
MIHALQWKKLNESIRRAALFGCVVTAYPRAG